MRIIKMKKTIAILLAAVLAGALLSACSGSFSGDSADRSYQMSMANSGGGTIPTPAPMAEAAPMPSSMPSAASSPGGSYSGSTGADRLEESYSVFADDADISAAISDTQQAAPISEMTEKIIYTAHADIETVEFDETIEKVYDMLNLNGAFIESSYIGGRNYVQSYTGYQTYRSANFTLRIPKERFEAVTEGLDFLGNVTSLRTDAQNITSQFLDTDSRLTSYRIQEERLLAMLEKADTVADMITIESSLSEVRYNIESLTSTLKNWQTQVDYSTLMLYISEVERYTETVPIQQTYWQQVGDGLSSTIKGIGGFFTGLFKWLIVNLPVLIILAAIIVAIVVIVRRKIKKNRRSDD